MKPGHLDEINIEKNLPPSLERDIFTSRKHGMDYFTVDGVTLSTVTISKVITRYLQYIDELYHMIEDYVDMTKVDKGQLEKVRRKYKKYKQDTGAEIKGVYYISREEPVHSIYENADFSPKTIKDSIAEGESKTTQILDEIERNK